MNKKTLFLICVCIALLINGAFAQNTFTWSLAVVKDNQGLPFETVDAKTVIPINYDESFHLEIFSERDCYTYIIVEMASGKILPVLSRHVRAGFVQKTGSIRFKPPAGEEKFYIITSLEEQTNLQRAIDDFERNNSERNAERLRTRLYNIRDPNEEDPGRPREHSSSIRGSDIQSAREFSGQSTYVRSITIIH